MTQFEWLTTIISTLALVISLVTAYKTFVSRQNIRVAMGYRPVLTKIDQMPSIIVEFEISNTGASPGTIDDIMLLTKVTSQNVNVNTQPGGSMPQKYTFIPYYLREEYSPFVVYTSDQFRVFSGILVPEKSHFRRWIVFLPSNQFTPSEGEMVIASHFRVLGQQNGQKVQGRAKIAVSKNDADNWKDPQGRSIATMSLEVLDARNQLSDSLIRDL